MDAEIAKNEDSQTISLMGDPTEDAIALAFAEKYKNILRYDHTQGIWFVYDGSRWKEEKTNLAFDWARRLCREYNKCNSDRSLPKMRTAGAVEKFAQADRRFAVTHDQWDQNKWLLCTPEFTVNLESGSRQPNNPDNKITRCTSVSPSNEATPIWSDFLDQATGGDKALQRFLKQVSGYCLTGSTREHALFFIHGTGGTGKTTYMNATNDVMGDYSVTAAMDTFTASKHDRHPTELARLKGARLVSASETEQGRAWAESRIKQLTGADTISARFMRKDFFEYIPEFKLIFLGNSKPVLHNVDEAQRRRFNIVPFNIKPTTCDKTLSEKLKDEYPGILQWAIDGCLDWLENGLIVPEIVQRETDSYFDDQDTFTQWLEECTEKKQPTTGEPNSRLYGSWTDWIKLQGETPGSKKSFAEKLISQGYQKVKNTPGYHGQRGFIGIALKVDEAGFQPYVD